MKKYKEHRFICYLVISLSILIIGIAVGLHQITPVKAPKDYEDTIITLTEADDNGADFNMTMSHVYQMSKEPHPSGSKAQGKVQNYLSEQLKTIGCEFRTHEFEKNMRDNINAEVAVYNEYISTHPNDKEAWEDELRRTGFSSYEEKYRADINCVDTDILELTNYLAIIDVPDTDRGIMFVGHYDSVARGPGASDDLISVSAMLEALRDMYINKDELSNDLYFLFTDGEEVDMLGAEAFVGKYPDFTDKIELVLNIEARGNRGAILMFETSENNKGIVKELNKALDHILMFSFSASVYRIMPNYTDLSEFLEKGYAGANFSMIGGPEHYHNITDTYDNLHRDSAYMYHKTVGDLAHFFGSSDLDALKSNEDGVYFPFLKGNTVIISERVMFVVSIIVSVHAFAWTIFLILHKKMQMRRIVYSLGILALCIIAAVVIGMIGRYIYTKTWSRDNWVDTAIAFKAFYYSLCSLSVIITLLLSWRSASDKDEQAPLVSSLLLLGLLNIGSALIFNSIAYIFTLPLFLLITGSVGMYWIKEQIGSDKAKRRFVLIIATLQGLITGILYTPVINLFYTVLPDMAFAGCMVLAVIAVMPVALIIPAGLKADGSP